MSASHTEEKPNTLFAVAYPIAGLLLGFGIVNLYFSFGVDDGNGGRAEMADNLGTIGFHGFDNIGLLPASDYAIGLVVVGALTLIGMNWMAWRFTNGY